jgi:hypothetical protein
MKPIICFVCLLFITGPVVAQDGKFSVSIDKDSVTMGMVLELIFTIENLEGNFEPPALGGFDIVGGPNQSTMMSIINGKVQRKTSYTYILKPLQAGDLSIGPANLRGNKETFSTALLKIHVKESADFFLNSPKPQQRDTLKDDRKRPTYKI